MTFFEVGGNVFIKVGARHWVLVATAEEFRPLGPLERVRLANSRLRDDNRNIFWRKKDVQ